MNFDLNSTPKDSKSRKIDHLRKLEEIKGVKPDELQELEDLEENELSYLAEIYFKIKSQDRINYQDIYYYTKSTGSNLQNWEKEAIIQIDKIYIQV